MIGIENWFLIVIALIWIIIAVIQDFKKREVANWLNFSLVAIALAYRAFLSVWFWNYRYFVLGLIGFVIFFVLANLFYYARVFAGGDAKLLMGLGGVLPFSLIFYENLRIFGMFIILLLFCGSLYGLVYSLSISYRRKEQFTKDFLKMMKKGKRLILVCFIPAIFLGILFIISGKYLLLLFPLIIILFPFLYIYAKSIEESCMIKEVPARELTEGDWLYKPIKVKGKTIKPSWDGLEVDDLRLLRKLKKKILIKQGIPFTPSFLIALVILLWFFY